MIKTGILFALMSAILFGASTPFAKLLLGAVDPWTMAGLLYLGAGVGLAAVHLSRGVLRLPAIEAPLRRSDLPWLALVIASGGIAGPLLLMFGLMRTDAAGASLLLNLEGLATMVIAWVILRENVDRRLLLGAFCIIGGAALLSWQGQSSFQWGDMLVAGACLCWGIDNNLTRKLSSADPVQIAMLKGLVAGTVNLLLALANGAAVAAGWHSTCGLRSRLPGIWREPCPVCARTAPPRRGAHQRLFLARPLCRRHSCRRYAGRAVIR